MQTEAPVKVTRSKRIEEAVTLPKCNRFKRNEHDHIFGFQPCFWTECERREWKAVDYEAGFIKLAKIP